MKSVFAMMLAGSLASAPALALNVDRQNVNEANAPAADLSLRESLTLRAKRNWARLALIEIEKNERLFNLVDANERQSKRVAIGIANTAVVGSLLALTSKLAYDTVAFEIDHVKQFKTLSGKNTLKAGRKAELEMAKLDYAIDAATPNLGAAWAPNRRAKLDQEVQMHEYLKGQARTLEVTPIQRTARGLKVVLAAGLVLTLAQDLAHTWIQISMTPDEVEQRKIDLRNSINDIERQLSASNEQGE